MSDEVKLDQQTEEVKRALRGILIEESFRYVEEEPHRSEILKRAWARVEQLQKAQADVPERP